MIKCLAKSSITSIRTMGTESIKGVDLKVIVNFLESFAPKCLAEKWDNTGLLLEPTTQKPVHSILLTNDLTEDVVQEALNVNASLIISYHPPIFKPLIKITNSSWKERIIATCLENKIALYSPHTSWDSIPGGVNDWLAGAFELKMSKPIVLNESGIVPNAGIGRYCELRQEIKISEAVEAVKKLTSLNFLNLALARNATLETKIKKIAICAGSGSTVLTNSTADLFLTGEMSHHSLLDAVHNNTSVIFCNHSNSERGFLKHFAQRLDEHYGASGLKVHVSEKDKDPIQIV